MNKKYLSLGLLLLILFNVHSLAVGYGYFLQTDPSVTHLLQSIIPISFDTVFSTLSVLGNGEISFLILIALLYKNRMHLVYGFGILGIAHVIELGLKKYLYHPGPSDEFFRYALPFVLPTTHIQPGYAYPSGHSLRMVFLALLGGYMLYYSKKSLQTKKIGYTFLAIVTILMLITRVSLGEHWVSDVIGGSLLGGASAYFTLMILYPSRVIESKKKNKK